MGGKGKGGARAMFLPPAKSRAPGGDDGGGPTITEKIKARKAAGGAESLDEFKARVAKQQAEQHALENHDIMLSAGHRELLDREREARLRREPAPDDQQSKKKRKEREREASTSSSEDSDGDDRDDDRERKRRRKEHKKSKKEKKEKSHKHKHHKHKKDKDKKKDKRSSHGHSRRRDESDDSDAAAAKDGAAGATRAMSAPVPLSQFLAEQSDSD